MSNISSFPTAIPDGDDLILGSQIDVAGIPSTKNFTVQSIVDLVPGGGGGGSYLPLAGGTMTGNTIHNDNVKSVYGTGNDLQIYNSGNNSYIQNISGAVGDLFIDNLVDDKDIILRSDNGAGSITNYIVCDGSNGSVSLNHYGNLKLETTTNGIAVTGTIQQLTDPSAAQDAATKNYVDNAVSGVDLTSYLLNTTDTFTGTLTLTGKLALGDASNNNLIGGGSGAGITTGSNNIGLGVQSLQANTSGSNNIGIGYNSFNKNTTGTLNIGIGYRAGSYITGGSTSNDGSTYSVFLGVDSMANSIGETNQIVIGYETVGNGSNTVTLGNDNITNTYLKGDVTVAGNLIGGLPYTSLVQLLNQTGTNAPVATEVYNNTGQTFTWSYVSTAVYRVTSTGTPFTIGKTIVFLNLGSQPPGSLYDISWERISDTTIEISAQSGAIINGSFEIKIYN